LILGTGGFKGEFPFPPTHTVERIGTRILDEEEALEFVGTKADFKRVVEEGVDAGMDKLVPVLESVGEAFRQISDLTERLRHRAEERAQKKKPSSIGTFPLVRNGRPVHRKPPFALERQQNLPPLDDEDDSCTS
jgi:hypothetical protein